MLYEDIFSHLYLKTPINIVLNINMWGLWGTILTGPELINMKSNHFLKCCEFDPIAWLL